MSYISKIWRARPLEMAEGKVEELLSALVEAWNRELGPLVSAMRVEVNRLGGEVTTVYTSYSVLLTDRTIHADATLGQVALSMPPAADTKHRPLFATKTDSSANHVSLTFSGSETCNGASTVNLTAQYAAVEIMSDGENYYIASKYP